MRLRPTLLALTVAAACTGPTYDTHIPFVSDPPAVYVAKVKNILVGQPPTDDEAAAVVADPTALGGPIEITTLTGQKVTHDLPRGIQTHEVIRLGGHGMPNPRGGRKGDLMVQVVVETPTHLTPEQEAAFRKLAELEKTQVGGPRKGFFGKIKDFFGGEEGEPK